MRRPRLRALLAAATLTALAAPVVHGSLAGAQSPPAADDTPPGVVSAVGLSRSRVRIRFTEPIVERSISVTDITLTMGGEARTISRIRVAGDGRTAVADARPPWPYGTAGSLRLRARLTDAAGNSARGDRPAVRVWASPGDVTPPVLRRVRLDRSPVCIVGVSRACSQSGGRVLFRVDEPVTIVLDLRRRSGDAPSLMKSARGEGSGWVRFREKIEGRRLRPGLFRLTVTAVDAAGNESRRVTLRLRVRS